MKHLIKNNTVFTFSYSKPIWNTKKWVESLPHILSILLHLMANVRKRKKMELTHCKLTHEQGLGGATCFRQRQSRPITCRVRDREVLSLPWCVTCKGLAANNCYCSSCLLERLALLGFSKMVWHKPPACTRFSEFCGDWDWWEGGWGRGFPRIQTCKNWACR